MRGPQAKSDLEFVGALDHAEIDVLVCIAVERLPRSKIGLVAKAADRDRSGARYAVALCLDRYVHGTAAGIVFPYPLFEADERAVLGDDRLVIAASLLN